MPSETGGNQTELTQGVPAPAPAVATAVMGGSSDDAPSLPCPRCESTNTKFCYYNNYNLSQPRHFCKSCRRYWTQGGSLRNVPVGGGTRKSSSSVSSAKRHRSSSSAAVSATATVTNNNKSMNMDSSASTITTTSSSSNSNTSMTSLTHEQQQQDHYSDAPLLLGSGSVEPVFKSVVVAEEKPDEFTNLKENRQPESGIGIGIANGSTTTGSFISLLNNQGGGVGGLGGYQTGFGAGHGYGYYDMGLGLTGNAAAAPRAIWPYNYSVSTTPTITTTDYLGGCGGGEGDGGYGGVVTGGNGIGGANSWQQLGDVDGGVVGNGNGGNAGGSYVDPEGFAWPSFVIPSPAKGLMK